MCGHITFTNCRVALAPLPPTSICWLSPMSLLVSQEKISKKGEKETATISFVTLFNSHNSAFEVGARIPESAVGAKWPAPMFMPELGWAGVQGWFPVPLYEFLLEVQFEATGRTFRSWVHLQPSFPVDDSPLGMPAKSQSFELRQNFPSCSLAELSVGG